MDADAGRGQWRRRDDGRLWGRCDTRGGDARARFVVDDLVAFVAARGEAAWHGPYCERIGHVRMRRYGYGKKGLASGTAGIGAETHELGAALAEGGEKGHGGWELDMGYQIWVGSEHV